MSSISDKVSAIDVSGVIALEEEPENHQYYRVYPAVRDDIVAVLEGTPQQEVPNREVVRAGGWRILPSARVARRPARKPRTRRA